MIDDFNTVPMYPIPEEPDEEKQKKEEKPEDVKPAAEPEDVKPGVEAVDWDAEPPAPEPDFITDRQDATRISDRPLHQEPTVFHQPEHEEARPVHKEPVEPARVEPERIDTPVYVPPESRPVPPSGELPPKKKKTWLIVLIVLLVLCVCCVIAIIIAVVTGLVPWISTQTFEINLNGMWFL
jgi:hypothetical protein